jgi:CheY-like chemotaxis protein
MVAVSDIGTGMSEDIIHRAFDPFFTTKPEGRGTGLGLSQVFGFVKQSVGHIELYSELGQGTTAKIYLPRHLDEGGREAMPDIRYTDAPRGTEAVLIVEDHDSVRHYAVTALRHLGYRVLEAAEGSRALALLADNPDIALLLTDVGLPGRNGREVAELARQKAPKLKVVFMTAYARNAISHHGLLDIGVHLLPKPFTVEILARKLRQVLDNDG